MAQPLEFQQDHLDRVSRSFAFCIRRLPQPLGRWVGLTYLICRILDTIEDSKWSDSERQARTFERFERAISDPAACGSLKNWEFDFEEVTDGERILLKDAWIVLSDFHEVPENVRVAIKDLVLSMSSGMRHFLSHRKGASLKLTSLAEVNQYCFFVAGLVGEALMQLVSSVEPRFPINVANLLRAHHFGLFLQKVNILKDQAKDEESGRWLIPSRAQVENSASSDAREALEFLCSIPQEQVEFRQFCGWSLFLGLETLVVARASFLKRTFLKISRSNTQMLLKQVDDMISDNQQLKTFFYERTKRLGWEFAPVHAVSPSGVSPDWLARIYRGRLDRGSLVRLGIAQ